MWHVFVSANPYALCSVYHCLSCFQSVISDFHTEQLTKMCLSLLLVCLSSLQPYSVQCESKKNPPPRGPDIFSFHKRLRICNRFFTHLLNVPIFARLQIFIQLSPILRKLCHIKRDYTVLIICAKCPKRTKTRAFRRLRKSLIALLIVVCGKSL